jgi:xanthine dehydrogenase molybdopterin-binding subunit B
MVIERDEWLFANEVVNCAGQIIGVIVASDPDLAKKAAKKVKVTYQPLKAIITTEQAIAENSITFERRINTGDVPEAIKTADHVIEGIISSILMYYHFLLITRFRELTFENSLLRTCF